MSSKEAEEGKAEFLPGFPTVQEFTAEGFKRVVNAVKAFHALPQPGPSWDLNKSYPDFSRSMKAARSKIVPMMASLLKHTNIPTADFRSRDIDEKFEFLVDCNDDLLEKIGSSLDEAEGLFKKAEIVVVDKGLAVTALKAPGTWGKRKLNANQEDGDDSKETSKDINARQIKKAVFRHRVLEKPQLKFSKPIDNSFSPFEPKLKEKPHSIKPLSILPEYTSKNEEFFGHPYAVELNKWEPSNDLLTKDDLLNKTEIAVDVEHHSYRTFLGLSCLIQVSTREKDYVIDGLSLRDHLQCLNEVFTDKKVLKVFHGASNDIEWLQRDFGLYIVSMFDTYVAAKALNHPQLSLQYLLGKYANVSQNKSFQLADWRIRPLPNDMLEYARQDTHYLLFIYEQMRNELIEAGNQHNNLLVSTYDQSRLTCLKRYEKPGVNPQLALRKTRRSLNNRQLYAFTEIYKWRDAIAREKDESLGYVLPNHMLLTIAETLPKEMNGILACCDPVPPLMHSNLGKIHKIVTTARELPLQQETTRQVKTQKKQKLKNWVVVVNSIHDITPIDASEPSMSKVCDNDEEFSVKTTNGTIADNSWPQPWADPGGWQDLIRVTRRPTMNFNRKVSFKLRQIKSQTKTSDCVEPSSDNITTPYGRYQISKKITEMLKDPKKQNDVDMQDPLVKAVYEAVLVEESEDSKDMVEEMPIQEPAKVLEDGEFIPFNPLSQGEPSKKRKKKEKYEPYSDKTQDQVEDANTFVIGQNLDNECGDDDIHSSEVPIMKSSKQKGNKKNKGKLLNRLKNKFSRNKNPKNRSESEDVICEEVEVHEEPKGPSASRDDANYCPPSKRMKRGEFTRGQKHQNKSAGEGPNSASPGQKKKFHDNRQKTKTNIFKAWKRDNRSITYK